MRLLCVHPSPLLYSELFLRLEPLGLERVAASARGATAGIVARQLAHRQTNFLRMLWKFNSVYNAERQLQDHARPVRYELPLPESPFSTPPQRQQLYVHQRATP